MQASFNMQSSYAMNRPSVPFPPSFPSFGEQNAMQYNEQAFSRSFGDSTASGYNSSYYASQMSRGPDGFNRSVIASNTSAFNQQGPCGNMGYGFQNFGGNSCYGPPMPAPRCDSRGWQQDSGYWGGGSRCDNNSGRNAWNDTGVNNDASTINLGNYALNFNKSDSSMLLTNTQNGNQTKIWGDPHIDLNSGTGSQTSGMFNGPLTFNLPDQTRIAVGTQPASGNSNVSYADNVTITQGNRAYVVNGLSQQDSSPLTVQRSNNGYALAQQIPQDAMNLIGTNSGTGWYNPQTHAMAAASDFQA